MVSRTLRNVGKQRILEFHKMKVHLSTLHDFVRKEKGVRKNGILINQGNVRHKEEIMQARKKAFHSLKDEQHL